MLSFRRLLAPAFLTILFGGIGCGDDEPTRPSGNEYLNGNTPAIVLENFRRAWRYKDAEFYGTLFADDYRFYFDPATLSQRPDLPLFWNRTQEVTQVGKLFDSDQIGEIRLGLTYNEVPETVPEEGREHWLLISVTDEHLEVDQKPQPGEEEGTTFLVEGQIQKFYFRRGASEADTLASSATSGRYYIVEWSDRGTLQKPLTREPTTWGSVKARF